MDSTLDKMPATFFLVNFSRLCLRGQVFELLISVSLIMESQSSLSIYLDVQQRVSEVHNALFCQVHLDYYARENGNRDDASQITCRTVRTDISRNSSYIVVRYFIDSLKKAEFVNSLAG